MSGRRKYSDEDVERGLTAVAIFGGGTRVAANALQEAGYPYSQSLLDQWKRITHPERYQEIRKGKAAEIREFAAQENEELVRLALEKEREFLAELRPGDMEARDRANALRNVSTTKGIGLDAIRKLRDEPDMVVEHRHSGEEMMQQIARKFPHLIVDGSAEEIEDAEVEEPKQLKAA